MVDRKWVENLRSVMQNSENIRNISVIAHVDHGKTTLTDSLLAKCGFINKTAAGKTLGTDTLKLEKERGITIKSTSVSLYYQRPIDATQCKDNINNNNNDDSNNMDEFVIHLIDCPGHVDFSSEVTSSLRVTDGALVVVDCIEGVCVQTETVLRQAMAESIVPILFLNKIDRAFLEIELDLNTIYQKFETTIASVNTVIQTYQKRDDINNNNLESKEDINNKNNELLPSNGKVGFGSGLHGWAFTLDMFAKFYSSRFGIAPKKMKKKLWGNHYWDPVTLTWAKNDNNGKLERGFIQFILRPVKVLVDSIMKGNSSIYDPIINNLGLRSLFNKDELNKVSKPKDFLKIVMKTWLPAGDTLMAMIVDHLPNPMEAQSLRMDTIYSGALDTKEATILRECNPVAPMIFYVSKMVPTADFSRFIAFGRVFSGTAKRGQQVIIVNDNENNNNVTKCTITQCCLMMGNKGHESIEEVPCGNVCGLLGIDSYLAKSGTLVENTNNEYDFMPFKTMNFNVSPIVQIAVSCDKPSNLPKLIEGLRKLSKFDNLVEIRQSDTGENIICGAGELHLETCLDTLESIFLKDIVKINKSNPIVSYNETIIGVSDGIDNDINNNNKNRVLSNGMPSVCVSKSTNKLNRLYCDAESLISGMNSNETIDFITDLEDNNMYYLNIIKNKDGIKKLQSELTSKYPTYWGNEHLNDIKNIWSFGSPAIPMTNILCDLTKGQQLMKDIKSDVISSFEQVSMKGVLCNEPLRGIKVNILDAKIHSDKSHRNGAQIIPCMKRVIYACEIANEARLMEPIYLVDILVKKNESNGVYNTLNKRRGIVIDREEKIGSLIAFKAHLPVSESFGFTQDIRANTKGQAFPSMQFSHWKLIDQNPYQNISNNKGKSNILNVNDIIMKIRERRGMKLELPKFGDFYDKIN